MNTNIFVWTDDNHYYNNKRFCLQGKIFNVKTQNRKNKNGQKILAYSIEIKLYISTNVRTNIN